MLLPKEVSLRYAHVLECQSNQRRYFYVGYPRIRIRLSCETIRLGVKPDALVGEVK